MSQTFFHIFALTDKNNGIGTTAELSFLQSFEHHVRFFLTSHFNENWNENFDGKRNDKKDALLDDHFNEFNSYFEIIELNRWNILAFLHARLSFISMISLFSPQLLQITEKYPEHYQKSKMEPFGKIVNSFQLLFSQKAPT